MQNRINIKSTLFAVCLVSICWLLSLSSCTKSNDSTTKMTNIQELAKEHSAALAYFYDTAISNGLVFDVDVVKCTTEDSNVIDENMIANILCDYNFKIPSTTIKIPIVHTKSGDSISNNYTDALDDFLTKIVSDNSFSSFDCFSELVLSSMERISNNSILNEYHEFTELALYILIDSYDYWINQEKFAEWVTTICTKEQQYQIALAIGHPELVSTTKSSGADMRAWADMCKSNDEATNGLLSNAIKSDSWGLAGSAVGGKIFGGLGMASCLFGAAWSSIGTLLGI